MQMFVKPQISFQAGSFRYRSQGLNRAWESRKHNYCPRDLGPWLSQVPVTMPGKIDTHDSCDHGIFISISASSRQECKQQLFSHCDKLRVAARTRPKSNAALNKRFGMISPEQMYRFTNKHSDPWYHVKQMQKSLVLAMYLAASLALFCVWDDYVKHFPFNIGCLPVNDELGSRHDFCR